MFRSPTPTAPAELHALEARAGVTVRAATAADHAAIVRMAGRDGDPPPAAPVLVSHAAGALVGVLSLGTGQMHHDPFRSAPAQRDALRARAAAATRAPRGRGGRRARAAGRAVLGAGA